MADSMGSTRRAGPCPLFDAHLMSLILVPPDVFAYQFAMRLSMIVGVVSFLASGCTNSEATKTCESRPGGVETNHTNPCAVCCKEHGSEQKPDHKAGKCVCAWQPIK